MSEFVQQPCSNPGKFPGMLTRHEVRLLVRGRDEAKEWPLCDVCYGEVADEVLVVADPAYCFGTCRGCGEWFSVRELSEAAGGGRYSSPSGLCRGCSRR